MDNNQPCLYQRGQTRLITLLKDGLCIFSGETLEALMVKHPKAEVMPYGEAAELIEQAHQEKTRQAPKRVESFRFYSVLGEMQPLHWRAGDHSESFMLAEPIADQYHMIICRLGDNYFELVDSVDLTHAQIVSLCRAVE